MFPPTFTKEQMLRHMEQLSDEDFGRHLYCIHMGFAFCAMNVMEHTIVHAMGMCDRIRLKTVLQADAKAWERMIAKRTKLEESTLGGLVQILSRHAINPDDIKYLRFVADKRNYFVHRFFRRGEWPGDMNEEDCRILVRRLIALNLLFIRVSRRIWEILAKNGLLVREVLSGGTLMFNPDLFKILGEPGDVESS